MHCVRAAGACAAGLLPAVAFLAIVTVAIGPTSTVPVEHAATAEIASYQPLFSADGAYGYLSDLVSLHPRRYPQTPAMRSAAAWARDCFTRLGLDARLEEFKGPVFYTTAAEIGIGMAMKSIGEFAAPHPGWNVVATLPGESPDFILVGAHLDVSYETVEGAGDDGSGVACVLELARMLSVTPRHYSYLFVLFDGEELALRGSLAFSASHPELPIRHALIIDTVGRTGDSGLYACHTVSFRGSGRSDALGLLRSAAAAEGFEYSVALTGFRNAPLFAKLLLDRSIGIAGMDTGAFQGRAETVVGIGTGGRQRSPAHTPGDVIQDIDPAVLGRTGRAAERYLVALDRGLLPGHGNVLYVPAPIPSGGVGILPDQGAWILFGAAGLAVLAAALIAAFRARAGFAGLPGYLRDELPFLLPLVGAPFALSCLLALVPFLPIVAYLATSALWFPTAFVLLPLLRRRRAGGPALPYQQKILLAALSLAVSLAWLVARGPFAGILAALPALLAGLGGGFLTRAGRVTSRTVAILVGLYSLLVGIVLAGMGFFEGGMASFAPLLGLALLTATAGVYGFSFPQAACAPVDARSATPPRASA